MFEFLKDPHKQEMSKMLMRQALQFGAGGLVIAGYLKSSTVASVFAQYDTLFGAVISIVTTTWMIYRNTKSAMTTNVVAFDEVKGIITERTTAGIALADAVPSAAVVPVSTTAAREIAA